MPSQPSDLRSSTPGTHRLSAIALACAVTIFLAAATAQDSKHHSQGDDSQVIADFETRISHYLDERKKQAGTSPRPTNSPKKLDEARQTLSEKSQQAREAARQGDVFTPDIAEYFRRQIAKTLAGPEGARIRVSLHNAEPVRNLAVHVNQRYPQAVPLQSTPPSLLLNLPELPKELQYRIVGRNLILLDVTPKLIVDYVPEAIPPNKD